MAIELIGRKLEKKVLKEAIDSSEAEMVVVIGRRRIGKTFLITSWVIITAFGFKPNTHSLGLIENHITLDVLFEDISLNY